MADQKSASSPLETWLAGLSHDLPDGEVAGYVALGGGAGGAAGYAIVKLPSSVGPVAVGRHMEAGRLSVSERIGRALEVHAEYARDLERALQEKSDYVDELVMERERAEAREAATRLENQALGARVERLQNEIREYRSRTSVAEGLAMRVGMERDEAMAHAASGADTVRLAEVEGQLASTQAELDQQMRRLHEASRRAQAAKTRAEEIQSAFDEFRQESVARAAQRQRAATLEQTRALDEATGKLLGTRAQLRRSEERIGELQARLQAAESELAKLQLTTAHDRAPVDVSQNDDDSDESF